MANITKRPIPADKPVTGSNIFTHESGIHCRALLADHNTYQSLSPKTLGRNPLRFEIGKSSGASLVRHVLHKCGVDVDTEAAREMIPIIRKAALQRRRNLTTQEVKMIWRRQAG